ncbi:MAG: hypothetical protein M1824_004181 [Vezdaea acicularis]|nr:MAG: hypothetical protein M1824_004181 [Vezdaea acicularis]
MSTTVWPPLPPHELQKAEEASLARELAWLLKALRQILTTLSPGLTESLSLLSPSQPPSILPLSTHRSEALKGTITRHGSSITSVNITLRIPSLPATQLVLLPSSSSFVIAPLEAVVGLLQTALEIVQTGEKEEGSEDARKVKDRLAALLAHIQEARSLLKGVTRNEEREAHEWTRHSIPAELFTPPLDANLSLSLSFSDSSLALTLRHLTPITPGASASITGLSLRKTFAPLLGPAAPSHDEVEQLFRWGEGEVKVREKIRVESQDPCLMAVMAKLAALEHAVEEAKRSLSIVMGDTDTA